MDLVNLVGKFLFILMEPRYVLTFQEEKNPPLIDIFFFWFVGKNLNYSRCYQILV